jgi:hypothetical protein
MEEMGQLKEMTGNMPGAVQTRDMLNDIKYPASKDELISQLQQKGVPPQAIGMLRGINVQRFTGPDDVISKVQAAMWSTIARCGARIPQVSQCRGLARRTKLGSPLRLPFRWPSNPCMPCGSS